MALHAGALEVRPDLPPARVAEAAGLIRSTARQALEELRTAIGVLRDGAGNEALLAPQPALGDIARLVQESRQAGLDVMLDMEIETPEAAPGALGRDACRIVREALTNASKHAAGTKIAVSVVGRPGHGLQVTVRNPLPDGPAREPPLPGTGTGLAGLAERVAVADGTLSYGPDPAGNFILNAALRWPA
jgi:signal transduction histidine kinase